MDEKTKQLADSLRANPSAAQAVFHSQDGRRLMEMLTEPDQGEGLRRAAQSAAKGDLSQMAGMVSRLMQSPEGAALAERIKKAVQQ